MNPSTSSFASFLTQHPIPAGPVASVGQLGLAVGDITPEAVAPPVDREASQASLASLSLDDLIHTELLVDDEPTEMDGVEVEDFGSGPFINPPSPDQEPVHEPDPSPDLPFAPATPAHTDLPATKKRVTFAPLPSRYPILSAPGPFKSILRNSPPDSNSIDTDTPSPHDRVSSPSNSPEPAPQQIHVKKKIYYLPKTGVSGPRPRLPLPPPPPPPVRRPRSGPNYDLREQPRPVRPPPSTPPTQTSKKKPQSKPNPVKRTQERQLDSAESADAQIVVPEEYKLIPHEVLDQLDDEDHSVSIFPKRLGIEQDDGSMMAVGVGDVVEIKPDFNTNPGHAWLGLVTDTRGLVSDEHEQRRLDGTTKRDKLGRIKRSFETVYLRLDWLYAVEDFVILKTENKSVGFMYSHELKHLGPMERVLSDHQEYYRQGRVKKGQVKVLYFNDLYPAVADAGLVDSVKHPLKVAAHHATTEYDTTPPSYFFGDEGATKDDRGPDRAWKDAVVVRAKIALQGERVAKPDEGEETIESDLKTKKRKSSVEVNPTKKTSSASDWKHLTFNQFGPRDRAFHFNQVQVFSHLKSTWYTVDDMIERDLLRPIARVTDPPTKDHPLSVDPDGPLQPLAALGQDPIVRGGVFGLTGNALLVTKAKELLVEIILHDDDPASSSSEGGSDDFASSGLARKGQLLEEAIALISENTIWKGWVSIRRERVGPHRLQSRTCPPRFGGNGEQRWVSPSDKTLPILTRHEESVLRGWEEGGVKVRK